MPLTIQRLRLGIVALAALLLLTIVGSFFYGRWRLRHAVQDLPGRLGIQIQQSTKGFVLSQSNSQGRTLFTLRAARAVEFKSGGRVSLHNVKIDLYNRQNGAPDTIAGDDFEYDPHSEVVQSQGESYIVLHAPETSTRASGMAKSVGQSIRITTHGLVFNQKTGVATCSGEVDFATSGSSGQAVGAEFNSKRGTLMLESEVVLTTTMQDQPSTIHANHALYIRDEGRIDLSQPKYTSRTPKGMNSGMAGTATIFLRADNSAERLDARDGVRLKSADGMAIQAPFMQVLLSENNQPLRANFSGRVAFAEDQPGLETGGVARAMEVDFDPQGRANRVVLADDVQFRQRADAGVLRTLAANHLVLNLLPGKNAQARLQSANATGNAVFTSASTAGGQATQQTTLAAQVLNTIFDAQNQPEQVDGTGQTRLETVASNGNIDTSTGDTLHIEFARGEPKRRAAGSHQVLHFTQEDMTSPLSAQSIRSAVQTGHVVLQQTAKHNAGTAGPKISTATAARASYVAGSDTLTLTGDPVFRDAQLEMTARRIEVERSTGKVVSTGSVQATMQSATASSQSQRNMPGGLMGGSQPVHIIAEQAVLLHDGQNAVFSGRARLWQGGDIVEAPIIELSQKMQTLTAYSDQPCAQCVSSNFLSGPDISGKAKPSLIKGAEPSTFRVLSGKLVYSDAERKARFLHSVEVIISSGRLKANQAEIFLTPSGQRAKAASTAGPASVEKIIATGDVRLLQPGRSATGSRLIYTAKDGHFVLTGDEKNPPQVDDRDRGTVTGQVLTFASREQAIMVSGASGHATTTKTRVRQ